VQVFVFYTLDRERIEMSSDLQIEANRRNAQRSTGPRTGDGKARVASNALKHGLTGTQVVLPNENAEDFEAFRVGMLSELNPQGGLEEALAEKIIVDLWRLRRIPVLEAATYVRGNLLNPDLAKKDPLLGATFSLGNYGETFANLWRHETALSRSWSKTLHELQRLQAMRAGERVPVPAAVDVDVTMNRSGAVNPE
jgi:hypothetical protein